MGHGVLRLLLIRAAAGALRSACPAHRLPHACCCAVPRALAGNGSASIGNAAPIASARPPLRGRQRFGRIEESVTILSFDTSAAASVALRIRKLSYTADDLLEVVMPRTRAGRSGHPVAPSTIGEGYSGMPGRDRPARLALTSRERTCSGAARGVGPQWSEPTRKRVSRRRTQWSWSRPGEGPVSRCRRWAGYRVFPEGNQPCSRCAPAAQLWDTAICLRCESRS